MKELGTHESFLILDNFSNELYQKFITDSFSKEHILTLTDCTSDILYSLKDKPVIVIGTYLAEKYKSSLERYFQKS